jgi:hypothetical protein
LSAVSYAVVYHNISYENSRYRRVRRRHQYIEATDVVLLSIVVLRRSCNCCSDRYRRSIHHTGIRRYLEHTRIIHRRSIGLEAGHPDRSGPPPVSFPRDVASYPPGWDIGWVGKKQQAFAVEARMAYSKVHAGSGCREEGSADLGDDRNV